MNNNKNISPFTDFVSLVKRARIFATEAHKGVYRKGKDENGELVGKTDYERVGHEMMAEGGNDYGVPLKARLNDFAAHQAISTTVNKTG